MRLLLATRNAHKASEIALITRPYGLEWTSLTDFPAIPDVEEDGKTLEENASKKALLPARASGLWTLADDTGLEVPSLGGAPGVHSARYAGPDCDFAANNAKLLDALKGMRGARREATFRCVMALAAPDGRVLLEEGRLDGLIVESPRGGNGFGYDPVFFLPEEGRTLAELSSDEKNVVSHRARALVRMLPRLEEAARDGGPAVPTASRRRASVCPVCGRTMEAWHCRELCPGCGYQIDCSDPF